MMVRARTESGNDQGEMRVMRYERPLCEMYYETCACAGQSVFAGDPQ